MKRTVFNLCAAVALATVFAACSSGVHETAIQDEEWRRLSPSESSGVWRQKHPNNALVATADFDSDGIEDHAFLRINIADGSLGIFVANSATTKERRQRLIERFQNAKVSEVGVAVVPAGTYRVSCASGPGTEAGCGSSETRTITLSEPGIKLFEFESSSLLLYWDKNEHVFKKEWLSD